MNNLFMFSLLLNVMFIVLLIITSGQIWTLRHNVRTLTKNSGITNSAKRAALFTRLYYLALRQAKSYKYSLYYILDNPTAVDGLTRTEAITKLESKKLLPENLDSVFVPFITLKRIEQNDKELEDHISALQTYL